MVSGPKKARISRCGVVIQLRISHRRKGNNRGIVCHVPENETGASQIPIAPADSGAPRRRASGEIIERFFLDVVRPALNRRVQSLAVWSAYMQWCADRGLDAVSHARFGRLARWRKDRIGGAVWYLDCELAVGYTEPTASEPKAL